MSDSGETSSVRAPAASWMRRSWGTRLTSRSSARRILSGFGPTPPSARDTCRHRPASSRAIRAQAATIAKSPARRTSSARRHHFPGREVCEQESPEEPFGRRLAHPPHRADLQRGTERHDGEGQFRRGIAVCQAPPDRPPVAHPDIADQRCGFRQQGAARLDRRGRFQRAVSHQCSDLEPAVVNGHAVEPGKAVHVDERARPGKAEVHQGHEALPSREHFPIGEARQQPERLVEGRRGVVGKRGWVHDAVVPDCVSR